MRKVLLGTTALAAVGLLAGGAAQAQDEMAGPVSVSVGGYYNAAVGFVSGDAGEDRHSPAVGHSVNLIVGGSTTLDNGITVGVQAKIEEFHQNAAELEGLHSDGGVFDEHHAFFSGPFGDIKVGAIESAAQQLTNFAPSGAGIFGVNSPHFIFAIDSYITTYDDGLGVEDSAKLVYFTPAVNGFRLGASYAPSDTENGRAYGNGNAIDGGGYKDQWSVGAEYTADFGDASLRAMVGYEGYEYDGMCDSSVAYTQDMTPASSSMENYLLVDKLNKIREAVGLTNDTNSEGHSIHDMRADRVNEMGKPDETGETPINRRAVEIAKKAWNPDGSRDGPNPLLHMRTGGDRSNYILRDPKRVLGQNENMSYAFYSHTPAMMGMAMAENCSPDALRYGATVSSNGFSFGGGALHTDVSNQHTKMAYDLGLSYGAGAYTLGLVWAHAETEEVTGGEIEQDRYAVNASYVLGPGISLQAQADTGTRDAPGMEEVDWTQIMFGTSVSF